MKYNILILDNEFGMGGVEKKLYDFIARLDTDRFAVHMCALKRGGYFKEKLVDLGIPVHEGLLRHKFDAFAFGAFARILREARIDLIYTFGHPNTVILSWMARRRGLVTRVVVSYHAMPGATGRKLVRPYLRPFLGGVDAYLALAETHRRYLVEIEGLRAEKVVVIRNGVDTAVYHPGDARSRRAELGLAPDDVVFTTVASLRPVKGVDVLLRSAAPVLEATPRLRLLVAGDGQDRGALEALARELGVADRVVFAGIRDDVEDVYRLSDAVVVPSRSEAFPNVVLEAMASGLAVVTTDVGSVREMVEDGESALVVPPDDTAALGSAIAALCADADRRARMGRRGREIVEERFRIERMCEERERLFERLIAGKA